RNDMGDEFLKGLGKDIRTALRNAGVKTAGLHQLQFEFLGASRKGACTARDTLKADGFTCKVGQEDGGGRWVWRAARALPIDVRRLDALGVRLVQLAEQVRLEFNGWEVLAIADELFGVPGGLTLGSVARKGDPKRFPHVMTAWIPEAIEPVDRGKKYDAPVARAIRKEGVGIMVGAASQLNGSGDVISARLNLQVADVDRALPAVVRLLRELAASQGSFVEFQRKGRNVKVPVWK